MQKNDERQLGVKSEVNVRHSLLPISAFVDCSPINKRIRALTAEDARDAREKATTRKSILGVNSEAAVHH
jgi:hypothetical protein